MPVSSWNSRRAASSGCSPASTSPFGTDQARASLRAQNGPPMWPISTSSTGGPPDDEEAGTRTSAGLLLGSCRSVMMRDLELRRA